MHISPSQIFRAHLLAGCSLNQWRPTQKDRAVAAYNYRLIAHCRNISSSSSTGAHHGGNLRDALAGHARLVIEDAPEMFAVGEDIGLEGQKCAARIDQVNAW